jgi:hypothetical protein
MLYPSEKEFKTWVQNQELNEVRAELKRRLIASLNESTRKNVKEIFSPFNTINS